MRTTYFIKKMDCSAEEQMIRMRLAGIEQVEHLTFDLSARRLIVEHTGNPEAINSALDGLPGAVAALASPAVRAAYLRAVRQITRP